MHSPPLLHLRPANFDDAKNLFVWRNDIETRKNSRNADMVEWEEHFTWFTKTLSDADPSRTLYIAEDDGIPIGTVRADRGDEGVELSWTVAPEMRGWGYGKAMVLQFVQELFPEERLIAIVEESNSASERIALALGLQKGERLPSEGDSRSFFIWRTPAVPL